MNGSMQSALFNLGFRPFFLLGAAFAVVAMALWIGPLFPTAVIWHAHEMIYGFTAAVIAGFLLTAVRNWTGVMTLHGAPLAALATLWLAARLLALFPDTLIWAAKLDGLFLLFLLAAIFWPVYRVRQWRQWGVLACLAFLLGGQILFLLGATGILPGGRDTGIRVGLFAALGLIFIIGARVIPFFTERGAGHPVAIKRYPWIDRWIMALFTLFAALAIFAPGNIVTRLLALMLAALHLVRLSGWYDSGIWHKPLLWVLHLAYLWLILGWVLFALAPGSLAIHAWAAGGLGGMVIGMICRVSLGHTGRDIHRPPRGVAILFALVFAAAMLRTALPWLLPQYTLFWYRLAGLAWIGAFSGFLWWYAPMLWQPRADGKPD